MPPTVDNSTIAADGRMNAPPVGALNPRLRPQRLFQKVQVAMEIAKKIKDSNQVTISEWISEPDMERFLLAVRGIVRKNLLVPYFCCLLVLANVRVQGRGHGLMAEADTP